jgi:hypothetical protein
MSGWWPSTRLSVFMSLNLQTRLFLLTLSELSGEEAWNVVLEITVDPDRIVRVERFSLPG